MHCVATQTNGRYVVTCDVASVVLHRDATLDASDLNGAYPDEALIVRGDTPRGYVVINHSKKSTHT